MVLRVNILNWPGKEVRTKYKVFLSWVGKGIICPKQMGKRKVQGAPQSQTSVLPRHQEEGETDKSKQTQIEQTYEKH